VNALATTYSKRINRQIDPLKEIVVTVGATEALFVAMQAIVKPGDEVILIEPFYDSYPHCVVSNITVFRLSVTNSNYPDPPFRTITYPIL
jgi:aspartate/methionine/tyrosine aminotransferase